MNLRPYQVRTLEQLDTWFAANPDGNPIVSACVGAGKSIMIAEFCRRAVLDYPDYRTRILMLVPSKELLTQNIGKLSHLTQDINIGIVSASLGRKDTAFDKDVVIATVGSVAKNPGQLGRLDIILVDECHLINRKETGQYRKLIADCQRYNPDLRVIGLTGTPFRGNGIWLTEGKERLFTDIAARVTLTELLDSGFLSPLVTADTGIQVSASEVRQSNGDYVVSELEKLLDDSELTQNIAQTIVSLGKDRNRWLVYGVTVAHATHLCEAINALGIRAEVVSAQTPAKERGRIINDFKRGKLRCLCNVAVLTTGFDVPELDLIALVRNTKSPVLYTQIAGRGMRIADGKTDCLWLDFTDTTANMGPVDRVKGRGEPKAKDEPVDATFKICPGCGSKLGTTALQCPVCGQEFDPSKPAINDTLSTANILSETVFNTYPVQRVTYAYHKNIKNQDKPPTLKVTYWSYVNPIISEWVCLEHSGYAQAKAIRWWQSRSDVPMPLSIDEFFDFNLADSLQQPVSITVKEGGEWPELISCHFEHEPEIIT